jgi:hypothetical protein
MSRHFSDCPDMVCDSRFHSRGDPERLVDAAEIVVYEVERGHVLEIFDFFREATR